MLSSKIILNTIAVLALVAAAVPLTAGKAEAYACLSQYAQGVGTAKRQLLAKSKARSKWTSSVKGYLGLPWSVWNIAKSKSTSCTKVGSNYKCVARAKPCKYVVN
jgi:hypothetical protein